MQRTQLKLWDRTDGAPALYSIQLAKPVWMNAGELARLFHAKPGLVRRAISLVLAEYGLDPEQFTFAERSRGSDGRPLTVVYYHLDVVILLGFRIEGPKGLQVRLWASRVLRDYLNRGFTADTHTFPHLFYAQRGTPGAPAEGHITPDEGRENDFFKG